MKNQNSIIIPAQALELGRFLPDDPLSIHVGENTLVVVPESMTAMEAVNAIAVLDSVITELLNAFKDACGSCMDQAKRDGCPAGNPGSLGECPYKGVHGSQVTLSNSIREEMGISPGAKLHCFVDEGEAVVTVADYEHDITDVPENVRPLLALCGVCPGKLDELIMDGVEVWHG